MPKFQGESAGVSVAPVGHTNPPASTKLQGWIWRAAVHDIGGVVGQIFDICVLALEPSSPPFKSQIEVIQSRPDGCDVGVLVAPGPHDGLYRALRMFCHRGHSVAIPVMQAAHHQDWRLDCAVILADRAVLPVLIPVRRTGPPFGDKRRVFHPI